MIADASADELETLGPFQRDILLGYRHALNDVEGTELLVGLSSILNAQMSACKCDILGESMTNGSGGDRS